MMAFVWLFVFLGIPALLTLGNVVFLFAEKRVGRSIIAVSDAVTFALGTGYTVLLASIADYHEWHEQVYVGDQYTPVAWAHIPTFITLCAVALAGYLLLRFLGHRLSPLIAALCYGGVFIGFALIAVLAVQLSCCLKDLYALLFLLFPLNYVLCAVRLMRNTVADYAARMAETRYDNRFLQWCAAVLSRSASFILVSFLLAIPLLLLLLAVLTLFGQQPDAVVKMFTDTAEWTLSQQIPPPRLDYDGHYLCTVAACGDERVVKPLRAGRRRGRLIVVNRQLLVANAFEDLMAERAPRLHRVVRRTYDRIGLPISKHITTKRRSNAVYWLMKPLEWLFVAVLYTFDTRPENRIHSQYLG